MLVGAPAIALSTVVPAAALATGAEPPADADGTNGATPPELTWQPCGTIGAECATATVPLDYDDPAGPTIELSVARLPATDPANRIGSLFFNPGGPGGPGAQEIRDFGDVIFDADVRARFDVVGFDPRGVGDSTPLRCFASAEERDQVLTAPRIPLDAAERQQAFASARAYGERCAANAGPLLAHLSTANVARDMDLLRQAVGDEQLTYVGASYGTHLGTVYANLFPDRIRALALDGNLDAVAWTTGTGDESRRIPFDTRIQSGVGAAATLDGFLGECAFAGPERCAFAADGDPFHKWDELLARLREAPIPLPQPDGSVFELDYSTFVSITVQVLYGSPEVWTPLAADLQSLYAGVGAPAAAARMQATALAVANEVGFADGPPFDDSFTAVTCSETDNPTRQRAWTHNAAQQAALYGAPGEFWAWGSLPCATWPAADEDRYTGAWDVPTSNPILLVNNFFDPATSFESAVNLAGQLGDAQLLPVAGYGHVAFLDSTCARNAIDSYLIDLQLPDPWLVCEQDARPFDSPAQPAPPQTEPMTEESVAAVV